MADIEGLKQRIELIDLRLKTAHSARERESAALMEIWEQIRDRFQSQNDEIVALRRQIAALEDTRNDLQTMVNSLLGAVETGLERMSDETVPQIRDKARGLLGSGGEDGPDGPREEDSDDAPGMAFWITDAEEDEAGEEEEDFLTTLERSIDIPDENGGTADSADAALDIPERPMSRGIRDLIARVEDSVGHTAPEGESESVVAIEPPAEASQGLNRDLLEIEQLRSELLGLRKKISVGGR